MGLHNGENAKVEIVLPQRKLYSPIFNSFWKLYPPPSPVDIINQRRFVCNKNSGFLKFPKFHLPKGTVPYDPIQRYRAFGYRTCKQDTEERYSGYNNLANGKEPSRTNQIRPSSKMFPNIPVGPNRNDPFHLFSNRNFRNFGVNGKRPTVLYDDLWSHVTGSGSLLRELNLLKHWFSFVTLNEVRSWWSLKHELPFTTNFYFNSIPYLFY